MVFSFQFQPLIFKKAQYSAINKAILGQGIRFNIGSIFYVGAFFKKEN